MLLMRVPGGIPDPGACAECKSSGVGIPSVGCECAYGVMCVYATCKEECAAGCRLVSGVCGVRSVGVCEAGVCAHGVHG